MTVAVVWEQVATIVRSDCHERTWIAHCAGAGFDDTPAGPLRVVKRAAVELAVDRGERTRWVHRGDTWILEVAT